MVAFQELPRLRNFHATSRKKRFWINPTGPGGFVTRGNYGKCAGKGEIVFAEQRGLRRSRLAKLVFPGVFFVVGFGLDCCRVLLSVPGLSLSLSLPGLDSIKALAEPSLLGPRPVSIKVGVKQRPFHSRSVKMVQQSACHVGTVNFPVVLN